LPIAGSIKARGGVYEVLYYAEKMALEAGLIQKDDDYTVFCSEKLTSFFSQYTIGVGSTGNLGLSIGIIAAKLGFNVSVYMSSDAKQWKKDLLRAKGVNVLEFAGDFGEAIYAGREQTNLNKKGYFVDDENSRHLFLGYSVAAIRLEQQLALENIKVDHEHPLFVYLPCGVGGSPGGIAYGLREVFGDHVHCFFVEPTHSPAVLIGLLTGEKEKVCVQDFCIDNVTEGDGLAVGRPSSFASSISEKTISGMYTLEDNDLFKLLALLADSEGILVEPSAASGLVGPINVLATDYFKKHQLNEKQATHIVWATGGSLVPREDMDLFYEKGIELLNATY
jgi:D-serine dehydratase